MKLIRQTDTSIRRACGRALLAAALAATGMAHAANYYVDVDWTGAQSGTTNAPYKTIKAAVDAANAVSGTHNIYIAAGWYGDVANGGTEDYSAGGGSGGGINITKAINFYGGYAGWDGDGTDPSDFDWTAGARIPHATVVDLQGAASRALYRGQIGSLGTPIIDGLTFCNANHTASGGAIATAAGSYNSGYTLNNCLFTNNVTTGVGGAVDLRVEALSQIRNCDFRQNRGSDGGAVYWNLNYQNDYKIENCTFTNNTATGSAGAVYASSSYTKWIIGSRFFDNSAGSYGGGVFSNSGRTEIDRCVFIGNSAGNASAGGAAVGGDAGHHTGSFTLINTLVRGNTGGYAVDMSGANVSGGYTVDMLHCTVVGNTGGVRSRHHSGTTGRLRIRNSIITDNGAYGITRPELNDPEPILEYNNVTNNTSGGYFQCAAGVGSISNDPQFVDAAAGDFRLAKGSPCIDTGTNMGITTDLDGVTRPTRLGYDMGCYEERDLPTVWHQYAMAQETEVTPRIILSRQPNGLPTDVWIVLDTEDKGTGAMTEWWRSAKFEAPAAGVVFGATFTGLSSDTVYFYRVWVSNAYDTAWNSLGQVRTLPADAPLQLLWTPCSALQRWSTAVGESNWTANAGMTVTSWVQGASAVFEGLPSTQPNVVGGGVQFNSIKLTGVTSGTLTIGKVSGGDADHLVTIGDALIDAPVGTTVTLPQVQGSAGLKLKGGCTLTSARGLLYSGATLILHGTLQSQPPSSSAIHMLDTAGSGSAMLNMRGVNNSWTLNNAVVVRGGSAGTATLQNSTTTGSAFNPSVAGNLAITNTLLVRGDTRVGSASFTLSGDIEGPAELQVDFQGWGGNNGAYILNGNNSLHSGPLTILNSSRTGVSVQLNGTQGNMNITVPVNVAVSGTGTLICNVVDGTADQMTLANNASINLSGLTLAPNDPARTPGEYPIITPKSLVTGTFLDVVGRFDVAYNGTETYPNDVVLIVRAQQGTLILLR